MGTHSQNHDLSIAAGREDAGYSAAIARGVSLSRASASLRLRASTKRVASLTGRFRVILEAWIAPTWYVSPFRRTITHTAGKSWKRPTVNRSISRHRIKRDPKKLRTSTPLSVTF